MSGLTQEQERKLRMLCSSEMKSALAEIDRLRAQLETVKVAARDYLELTYCDYGGSRFHKQLEKALSTLNPSKEKE